MWVAFEIGIVHRESWKSGKTFGSLRGANIKNKYATVNGQKGNPPTGVTPIPRYMFRGRKFFPGENSKWVLPLKLRKNTPG